MRSTSRCREGVDAIDVDFQYVSPTADNQGRIVATPDMASIQWIANSLYPAGYYVRDIPVQASVIVPTGWKVATALRPSGQSGNRIDYPVTSYEILMDSPLIAGAHYRAHPAQPATSRSTSSPTTRRSLRPSRSRSPRTSGWSTRR